MILIGEKKLPEKFWTPLISDFYLRPNERFNRRRDMDRRKFNYSLGRPVLGFDMYHINISQDLDTWAQKSEKHPRYILQYGQVLWYRRLLQ